MTHRLREIRSAVKSHYQQHNTKSPPHGSMFMAVVELYDDGISNGVEYDINSIVQVAFEYYAENPYADLFNPLKITKKPEEVTNQTFTLDNQRAFITSVDPFCDSIKDAIQTYLPFSHLDSGINTAIEEAKTVLGDFNDIIQATERGEIVDTSEDYGFFDTASRHIGQNLLIAFERFSARTAAEKDAATKSAANAAKARYTALDDWKEEAREFARDKWRNGTDVLHNKIVAEMMQIERFNTTPPSRKRNGTYTPGKWPKEILLKTLATVADEPEFKNRNLKYGAINKK